MRAERSIRSPDDFLVHTVRENTGIGGGGFASWCDKAYYNNTYLVDEPATCLWCAAMRRRFRWDHQTNPCGEIIL